MVNKRIKQPKLETSISKNPKIEIPLFSFKYLEKTSFDECNDVKFFIQFLEHLKKLGNLGWNEIRKSHRHSFGTEKIPIEQIKVSIPNFITPDVKHLTVFRANGSNNVFVGHQEEHIFHIIFIEASFGDIYNH